MVSFHFLIKLFSLAEVSLIEEFTKNNPVAKK